jgi:hypothetical protein
MKGSSVTIGAVVLIGLCLLLAPVVIRAESFQAAQGPPPVAQPLIREGMLATRLAFALNLGTVSSEAEAENWLGDVGISPKNGWIADYPVTPDISVELYQAVGDAADAQRIRLTRAEALDRFNSIVAELAIAVNPSDMGGTTTIAPEESATVPSADVYDYYSAEGPPVLTFYPPPYNYYGFYSWVPFPFWCDGYWFGGYFILNDFHRAVFNGHSHHREFVTNHFYGKGNHHVGRVNPLTRSGSRFVRGTGAASRRAALPAVVQGGSGSNFTASHARTSRPFMRSTVNGMAVAPASRSRYYGNRNSVNYSPPVVSSASSRTYSHPAGSHVQRSFTPSHLATMTATPSYRGGGGFSRGGFSGGHGRR